MNVHFKKTTIMNLTTPIIDKVNI